MPGTLVGIFLEAVARYRKSDQFKRKRGGAWESISAERALGDVERLALGLRDLGLGAGDSVALLSETRYEWVVADLAILGLGALTVPIYPTLTGAQCRFVLENSGAKLAIVSTAAQLARVREAAAGLSALQHIIVMDEAPLAGAKEQAWDALTRRGTELVARSPRAYREAAARLRPVDLATIIYTSGTTGEPKGAMLTHYNIVSNVESCLQLMELRTDDRCLSFLPLSHIFERMAGLYAMLAGGVTIAYAENLESVAADAVEIRPTVLMGVPRFYEKVYARVMSNAHAQAWPRRMLFHWGLAAATAAARARFTKKPLSPWLAAQAALADRLVGAKVRARVGGRLRYCISGGAPLPPRIMEFFFAVGIPVIEGYGLTETSPVIALNRVGREKPGSVGPPIPGVEVRIAANGEILVRGPNVMQGYFHNEVATRAALEDGWFHTGDVGHLDGDGCLLITDRLKDLLVTAGGKKVAPQPIEARLKTGGWVTEAVLIGDQRPFVVCLLVPNLHRLETEAKARGWSYVNVLDLLDRDEVRALYQPLIDAVNADLAPFEKIKRFALLPRELSAEEGELTPTFKVRRKVVNEHFTRVIEALYASPRASGAAAR